MTKQEAIDLIVGTKTISPFTRSFIFWAYKNGYCILSPDEVKKVDGMTILAQIHGMNPFEEKRK